MSEDPHESEDWEEFVTWLDRGFTLFQIEAETIRFRRTITPGREPVETDVISGEIKGDFKPTIWLRTSDGDEPWTGRITYRIEQGDPKTSRLRFRNGRDGERELHFAFVVESELWRIRSALQQAPSARLLIEVGMEIHHVTSEQRTTHVMSDTVFDRVSVAAFTIQD